MDEKMLDYDCKDAKLRLKVCPDCGTAFTFSYKDIYYTDNYYVGCPVCDKALLTVGYNWNWKV